MAGTGKEMSKQVNKSDFTQALKTFNCNRFDWEKASAKAKLQGTTLSALLREWIHDYVNDGVRDELETK